MVVVAPVAKVSLSTSFTPTLAQMIEIWTYRAPRVANRRPRARGKCSPTEARQQLQKLQASLRRGVSKVDVLVPATGALWNPRSELELRALAGVVAGVSTRLHRAIERPIVPTRRPGWAIEMVLEVLEASAEPLSVMEIVRAIETEMGEIVSKESVRSIVQTSVAARAGNIARIASGRYGRYVWKQFAVRSAHEQVRPRPRARDGSKF